MAEERTDSRSDARTKYGRPQPPGTRASFPTAPHSPEEALAVERPARLGWERVREASAADSRQPFSIWGSRITESFLPRAPSPSRSLPPANL